jgi:hypothetical protein
MIESKEKTINGVTYMVTQFPARRALKIQAKLIKLLAPLFFAKDDLLDKEVNDPKVMRAASGLLDRLDEDYVVNLVMELLVSTRREGKEITDGVFDTVYAGNFGELFDALVFVMEVNFKSFLDKINTGKKHQLES